MSYFDGDGLYRLLPAIYQLRDAQHGFGLRELLALIGRESAVVEQDIGHLYENWFIETCDPWLVPYLGDLVGIERQLLDVQEPIAATDDYPLLSRQEVANAVRFNRRKGTVAVLEQLALHVSQWRAKALEQFPLITQFRTGPCCGAAAQNLGELPRLTRRDHVRRLGSLRDGAARFPQLCGRDESTRVVPAMSKVRLSVWRCEVFGHHLTQAYPIRPLVSQGKCSCRNAGADCDVRLAAFHPLGFFTQLHARPSELKEQDRPFEVDPTSLTLAAANLDEEEDCAGRRSFSRTSRKRCTDVSCNTTKSCNCLPCANFDLRPIPRHLYGSNRSVALFLESGTSRKTVPVRRVLLGNLRSLVTEPGVCHGVMCQLRKEATSFVKNRQRRQTRRRANQPFWAVIDPELGIVACQTRNRDKALWVSYHYALTGRIGGGEYRRGLSTEGWSTAKLRLIGRNIPASETSDSNSSRDDGAKGTRRSGSQTPGRTRPDVALDLRRAVHELREGHGKVHAVFLFTDSGVYNLAACTIKLGRGDRLELVAASGCRPTLVLEGPVNFVLRDGATLLVDGITIGGDAICLLPARGPHPSKCSCQRCRRPDSCPPRCFFRHSSLLPSPRHGRRGEALRQVLVLNRPGACVRLDHSVVGPIRSDERNGCTPAVELFVEDSIVDAWPSDVPPWRQEAAIDGTAPVRLSIMRSTVLGKLIVEELALAENSLLAGGVCVRRQHIGGMRFCYVAPTFGADRATDTHRWQTPPQFYCQPVQSLDGRDRPEDCGINSTNVCENVGDGCAPLAERQIEPSFVSLHYGDTGYAQLTRDCPLEIRRGAVDESEVGVWNALHLPQREDNLSARVAEFTPVGMATVIHYEN